MRLPSLDSLTEASWYAYSDEPVGWGHWYTGGLCDPFLIMPEEAPDGIWHLFAHTWAGIMHYTSHSGFDWKEEHLAVLRGHSPFIFRLDESYCLLYETHDREYGKKKAGKNHSSRIEMIKSSDLRLWSAPRILLDSTDIPYASDGKRRRISSPQLISWQGHPRLYFGAAEATMYDTNRRCAIYLGYAEAEDFSSPFIPSRHPLLEGDADGERANLALGSVRMITCADGIAALACSYSYDEVRRCSTSSLQLLTSTDGLSFDYRRTLLTPSESGWMSSYITSAAAAYRESEASWYCYFSAEEKKSFIEKHTTGGKLGLLLGKVRK